MSNVTHRKKGQSPFPSHSDLSESERKKSRSSWSLLSVLFLLVKVIAVLVVGALLLSYFFTETWTFGYENKYTNWRWWIKPIQRDFTVEELAKYDGSDPTLPIYLAILGDVFDVSAGSAYYAKGSGYGFFAGKDASRAYITGCFTSHLTHDVRGLTREQIKSLEDWRDFYVNHHSYFKVGRVILPPIDPDSPIPSECADATPQKDSKSDDS